MRQSLQNLVTNLCRIARLPLTSVFQLWAADMIRRWEVLAGHLNFLSQVIIALLIYYAWSVYFCSFSFFVIISAHLQEGDHRLCCLSIWLRLSWRFAIEVLSFVTWTKLLYWARLVEGWLTIFRWVYHWLARLKMGKSPQRVWQVELLRPSINWDWLTLPKRTG